MTYENGDEYNGPFVKGLRHGEKGSMDAKELAGMSGVYIGDWVDDLMHGTGTLTWGEGTVCHCQSGRYFLPVRKILSWRHLPSRSEGGLRRGFCAFVVTCIPKILFLVIFHCDL